MEIKKIDLSIIIVNYRCWEQLNDCLISLENISLESINIEIIVVDNKSQDGNLKVFAKKFCKYRFILNSGNNGFSQANNVGVSYSNGDFLLFLNPDTIMNKKTLETLVDVAKNNPDYKLITCNKISEDGSYEKTNKPLPSLITLFGATRAIYQKLIKRKPLKSISDGNNIIFPSWISGSLVLMSKSWFDKIGGWNEDYWMYYEDVDLSKRTTDLNGKIVLIEDISIIHNHGGSSRINIKTKALTKAEVIASKHVYINNNFYGYKKHIAQILLLTSVIFRKSLLFIVGILFYYIPSARVNVFILKNLIRYYFQAIKLRTWHSQRSVNKTNRPLKHGL